MVLFVSGPTTNSMPRFVQKMKEEQSVVEGEDLVLECIVQGSPVPVVMWNKHDGDLPDSRASRVLGR